MLIRSIVDINYYFFESEHSQKKNDFVYSVIERAVKRVEFFVPAQCYMFIRIASKKQKYNVVKLDNSKIFDIQNVYQETVAHKDKFKISKMQVIKCEAENACYSYSALEETCRLNA